MECTDLEIEKMLLKFDGIFNDKTKIQASYIYQIGKQL